MDRDEIAAVIIAFGDVVRAAGEAGAADKADVYAQLGITLTYRPDMRLVEVIPSPLSASPCSVRT